ncbi:ABC transporter ATP-binding protein [Microbacterium sp. XT11]|uniref:ABC transporter ATP-binding protein n=1 Tax=Microbacterium sp. XT11 TaxID=367477 RepID=UPI0007430048|nr:ABC transporter ATP-binding protein [Microbacterium sp. XT11]ALX67200.1 iron-siderophore ABC transporter,ATPase and permease components [Microbacterium sp. XT11]
MRNPRTPYLRALPGPARRRLVGVSLGWAFVALAEAGAYSILAVAIAGAWGPWPVALSCAAAVVITVLVQRAGYLAGARLTGDLYAGLGRAFARTKLSWFTERNRTRAGTVAGRSIPAMMSLPAHGLQMFVHAPLIPLLLLPAVGLIAGWRAMLFIAGLLAVSLGVQAVSQRALARADAARNTTEHDVAEASLEFVDHLELLRTAAGPARATERLRASWSAQRSALARTNRASAAATFASGAAGLIPLAGVVCALATAEVESATALSIILLVLRAAGPLESLAVLGVSANDLRAHLRDYAAVTTAPVLAESAAPASRVRGDLHIELDDVTSTPALRGVTASIPYGTTVLVSGPSGSGKSTLLGLLMRFDDPDGGRITLGGVPLAEMPYAQLAALVAYVPQDPVVFTGTLEENIRLGDPTASDARVLEAANAARLGAVIERAPEGLAQHVGANGASLSGGERQRVAVARAFLKRAPILILDEATSALDVGTESHIADAVRALTGTVVIVTHRDAEQWRPDHVISLDRVASG